MNIKMITRKPIFWILFSLVSLGGIFFSYQYFSEALSIINVDIEMNRDQALAQAAERAKTLGWGPKDFRQAVMFKTDRLTQFYIELEAGGKTAFNKMIKGDLYKPYTWQIRNFKESEKNEVAVLFTPDGAPYGFKETISEDIKGPALPAKKAQNIAEKKAIADWKIDFSNYTLVESSKEERPSKRADHTFVYERPEKNIKEGRYRLKLVVSGDKLTELVHFVKVPDDFSRRYQEMRSANNTITVAAFVLLFFLYILGSFIALFFLFRQQYILWKIPIFLATILGIFSLASSINNIPIVWMTYYTALPARDFLLKYLLFAVVGAATSALLAAFVLAAGNPLLAVEKAASFTPVNLIV